MRIAELASRTGIAVPTIKFYLREGLIDPGIRAAANQSAYAEEHVQQLLLARALVDVGGLSVAMARDVLAAIRDPEVGPGGALGTVHRAITRAAPVSSPQPSVALELTVARLLEEQGWDIPAGSPARTELVRLLTVLIDLGHGQMIERLKRYAVLAAQLAELDLTLLDSSAPREALLESVVVGTVLGDSLFAALRHLAQEALAKKP